MATAPDTDWQALRHGEHAALERLYRAHGPTLLRYGRQFATPAAVQDAVQDLFVKLWERRESLTPDVQPRPYLLISLRNALLRVVDRAARVTELAAAPEDAAPTAEDELVDGELALESSANLSEAIAALAPRERELILLRFQQGVDYDEIVEITGLSYGSARNTVARAIAKLRRHLGMTIFMLAVMTSALCATHPGEWIASLS